MGEGVEGETDSPLSREPEPWDHDLSWRHWTTEPPRHPSYQQFNLCYYCFHSVALLLFLFWQTGNRRHKYQLCGQVYILMDDRVSLASASSPYSFWGSALLTDLDPDPSSHSWPWLWLFPFADWFTGSRWCREVLWGNGVGMSIGRIKAGKEAEKESRGVKESLTSVSLGEEFE